MHEFGKRVLGARFDVAREQLQIGVAHLRKYIAARGGNPTGNRNQIETLSETSAKRPSCSADFPAFACGFGAVASKRSGDGQVCCVADFQIRGSTAMPRPADLEVGDTAGLETCATQFFRGLLAGWVAAAIPGCRGAGASSPAESACYSFRVRICRRRRVIRAAGSRPSTAGTDACRYVPRRFTFAPGSRNLMAS